jgi:probable HAF family extracellular repeat protein
MKTWKPDQLVHLCLSLVLCFFCFTAFGSEVQDIGTLGGSWSAAYSVNDSDQIVGLSGTSEGDMHAFLWQNGQMQDLYPFSGFYADNGGIGNINNRGQIAGGVVVKGILYPAVWDNGNITVLGSFGGIEKDAVGLARSVNEKGQAVGFAYLPGGARHAFFYDGAMHDLGCPPANGSSPCYVDAFSINDRGWIVGNAAGGCAFLYDGHMHRIEPADTYGIGAFSINNWNQAVGSYEKGSPVFSFIFDGSYTIFSFPNAHFTWAVAINDAGTIAGTALLQRICRACNETEHGFMYQNCVATDLNSFLPPNSGMEIVSASGINAQGHISGTALVGNWNHAVLIRP